MHIIKQYMLLTLKVLVTTIDAQWEGMGNVGSARYEPALLPPCPTIRVLSYSNISRWGRLKVAICNHQVYCPFCLCPDMMPDLVIDAECSNWDQLSLNNTIPQTCQPYIFLFLHFKYISPVSQSHIQNENILYSLYFPKIIYSKLLKLKDLNKKFIHTKSLFLLKYFILQSAFRLYFFTTILTA